MVASGLVVLLVGAMAEPPGFKGHDRPVSYLGGGVTDHHQLSVGVA